MSRGGSWPEVQRSGGATNWSVNHDQRHYTARSTAGPSSLTKTLASPRGNLVEITIKSMPVERTWGEGLRRCAGALANQWTEEDDRILDEIHQDRKRDTRKGIS